MESKTTTAFAAIKQDVRMNEWMSQIQAQKASGIKYIFLIDPPDKAEY